MVRAPSPTPLAAASILALSLGLAGCASYGTGWFSSEPPPPPPPAAAPPPPDMNVGDFVGRWGLAAYHKDADRARTEAAARGQCSKPYDIGRGPTGGVMMHLADATQPQELVLKSRTDGRVYLGPPGPAPDALDRELITFDGRLLVLRWVDREISARYGTMVFARCGAPGVAQKKRKTG